MNDNPPVIKITKTPNLGAIREHSLDVTNLGYIRVTDGDSGVNGDVTCHLDDDHFQLRSFDGKKEVFLILLRRALDRESPPVRDYRDVVITCRDGGTPAIEATATFRLQLEDVNDNKPQVGER